MCPLNSGQSRVDVSKLFFKARLALSQICRIFLVCRTFSTFVKIWCKDPLSPCSATSSIVQGTCIREKGGLLLKAPPRRVLIYELLIPLFVLRGTSLPLLSPSLSLSLSPSFCPHKHTHALKREMRAIIQETRSSSAMNGREKRGKKASFFTF